MNISPSTYYKKTDKGQQTLRSQSDTALLKSIEKVLSDWPCYGYRRVTAEMRRRGIFVNHKRVARIMREQQLTVKPRRQKHTARLEANGAPYPNLAKGFIPDGPNQLWVGDLTYIRLLCGFVYLAVLIDAWSRRMVGYAVSQSMDVRLTLGTLNAAVHDRNPGAELIHHSDRGSQYLAKVYQARLMDLGMRGSMSRPGTPTDNPEAESFMKTLKYEEIYALNYETLNDIKHRLPRFLFEVYNRRRIHSALNYLTPEEFELQSASKAVN
jgi:putative transposase